MKIPKCGREEEWIRNPSTGYGNGKDQPTEKWFGI